MCGYTVFEISEVWRFPPGPAISMFYTVADKRSVIFCGAKPLTIGLVHGNEAPLRAILLQHKALLDGLLNLLEGGGGEMHEAVSNANMMWLLVSDQPSIDTLKKTTLFIANSL